MTPRDCQVPDCPDPQHGHGLCHRHLEQWRHRRKGNPDVPEDDLRPDRAREVEREAWLKGWLLDGKGPPLVPEVAPWPCEYHLRVSIPIIDRFLAPEAIEADWDRHRDELLARAEERGRPAWAAQWFG